MEQKPAQVFCSYAHEDKPLLDDLIKHLAPLQRERIISVWNDLAIEPGEEWEKGIAHSIEEADLILLLVTANFLASDFCSRVEVKRAMERYEEKTARVIPVIVRPCDWQNAPFSKLQVLPPGGKPVMQWDDPDVAWTEVAKGIRRLLTKQTETNLTSTSFEVHPSPTRRTWLGSSVWLKIALPLALLIPIGMAIYANFPRISVRPSPQNKEVHTFKLEDTLSAHGDTVWSIAFSPDGNRAASASQDGTVALWSTKTWIPKILNRHKGAVYMVTFSPDGKMLATASADKTVKLWDGETGTFIDSFPTDKPVFLVAFSPAKSAGYVLVSVSGSDPINGGEEITLWHQRTGWRSKKLFNSSDNRVLAIAFSPDAETLAAAGYGNSIQLWNGKTEEQRASLNVDQPPGTFVSRLAFSKDGNYLAAGDRNGSIKLWRNWEALQEYPRIHVDGITALAFSPDNSTLISASHDKTVRLWNVVTKNSESIVSSGPIVQAVSFSPDGQTLLIGGEDKKIQRWRRDS